MSDDTLSDKEILFLKKWMDDNEQLANTWPGDVLLSRVNNVLGDRFIEEREHEYLTHTLRALIGDTLADDPDLETREEALGVTTSSEISEGLNYLVIGTLLKRAGEALADASQIQKAIRLPEIHPETKIVDEELWSQFLPRESTLLREGNEQVNSYGLADRRVTVTEISSIVLSSAVNSSGR